MRGHVLDFSVQTNSGVLSGDDGGRYTFVGSEWRESEPPRRGMVVDFIPMDGQATAIYIAPGSASSSTGTGSKDKMVAGLLAIFLGALGIHKFYLGMNGQGLVFLLTNTIGWLVTWVALGLPNYALAIIAFIEGIIYLTKTDEEFHRIYVVEKKKWF